jgi:hypothetical protein
MKDHAWYNPACRDSKELQWFVDHIFKQLSGNKCRLDDTSVFHLINLWLAECNLSSKLKEELFNLASILLC